VHKGCHSCLGPSTALRARFSTSLKPSYTARVNFVARFFTSFTNGGFTSRPGSAVC